MLNHICVWLGPAPPTAPSLSGLPARTCVGSLPRGELMWQYPVTYAIKCPNTQAIKLLWHVKIVSINSRIIKVMLTWIFVILTGYYHISSQWGRVPMHVRARIPDNEGGVGGVGPSRIKMWFRATSHTRLKAHDHCNLRALIGWNGGDRPSSLHTRRWRPKGPKRSSWMKSLHGVLHGGLRNRVSWSIGIFVKPTSKRRAWRKFRETMIFLNKISRKTNCRANSKIGHTNTTK